MTNITNVNGILFDLREGTSDAKGVDEVITRKGYTRKRPFAFDVEPGENWIDLGASIGEFTLYALSKGAKHVVAYEPDPEAFECMKRNLELNSIDPLRWTRVKAAVVADAREMTTLYQNTAQGNVWRNSIEKQWRGGMAVEVPCIHISKIYHWDDMCVKIDIEGTEMPIIEWLLATDSIKRIKKLVFEWSFDIDPDLKRFRNVMNLLSKQFHVAPSKLYEEYDTWQKSWFPPCKTIFCLRK